MRPSDRKYLKSHEWAKVDEEFVIIGISDFAVNQLSDITHIDLPEIGDSVTKGEPLGEIESVKTVSDIISAVTGEVVEVNEGLTEEENFTLLTESAFDNGWLIKVKAEDLTELDDILDATSYEE
ncbi:MAG: glycine cleavage system protein GcvH, partial [Candidatus Heimdallarchaeota archaeon]|nr:glycine cleavage system protein GcvH [Candidatus Heimdallarchaeota archaeon]